MTDIQTADKKKYTLKLPLNESGPLGSTGIGQVDDRYDVIRSALTVHQRKSRFSSDLIYFMSSEQHQEFIRGIYASARAVLFLIKSPKIAKETHDMLVDDAILVSVLNRNTYDNPILSGVFSVPVEKDDNGGIGDKLKNFLGQKK